jgi:putative membrane protein
MARRLAEPRRHRHVSGAEASFSQQQEKDVIKFKLTGAALAIVMAAGATSSIAQTPPPPPPAEAMTQAMPYVMAAGMSDLYEINSSQIALQKSQNPKIRSFATMLIKDHQKTTAATMKAAQKAGLTPTPPMLDAGTTASITELQNASASDFDRLYIGQQIPAHQAAFSLHSHYANAGDKPQLRTTARAAIAPVQHHLDMATNLQKNMMGKMSGM